MAAELFPYYIERGCGIDVHRDTAVATIKGSDIETETKTFNTFTEDLHGLVGWLREHGITHVAMESTGVYWKPVYYILEDYFEMILVNARHVKNVPGQKTDKKDSEWLAKLLLAGLLKKSFVPDEHIRELRMLHRHRRKMIGMRTAEKNRLQNILEDANIKLASVVSDVFGKSASAMVRAMVHGEESPRVLAAMAKGSLVKKKNLLERALNGRLTDHHRFMMKMVLQTIDHINEQMAYLEARMDRYLDRMAAKAGRLETIPGVSRQIATGILAEIGTDMQHFKDHRHLASWAGVCPGNNESAGKKMSSRTTRGNKHLKTTLIEAAWAATRSRANPLLANKHRAIASRRGNKKAAMAIGHKILIAAYHILRDDVDYIPHVQSLKIAEKRKNERIKRLEKQLKDLKKMSFKN